MTYIKKLSQKIVLAVLMGGVLFVSNAQYAAAQWATTNPDVLANDLATTIQDETKGEVKGALLGALAAVGISLLDYVATLTAQSTAVWIANGAAGQHPLFNPQSMEEIGQAVSANVVADVLDQVVPGAGSLAAIGIDPNNPDAVGVLRKLLGSSYQPVQLTEDGRIDGGSIGRNFSSYIASTAGLAGTKEAGVATIKVLADVMNAASQNEFFGLLQTYGQTQARAASLSSVQRYKDILNAGFQDLTSPISQAIKWPAANVKKKLDDAITQKQQNDVDVGKGLVQAAGENAVIQVGINFLTTFAGTLFGELTNKLFDGLLADVGPVTINPFDPTDVSPGRSGEELFRSIGVFRPLDVTGYSLIAELASCPATLIRNSRGVYTCAMNTSFVSVVTRGNSNDPATVREAIESREINGDWPLVGPNSTLNIDPNCYQRAFCHSNLVKLRKARIVPVGWEIAATLSGDGKYSLREVMEGFYECNDEGLRDAEHPFCGLVDPNWILRAPEAVCRTLGYGQQLTTSAGAERAQECVDIQTCLEEGPNGECLGGYGYCLREQNVWRFRGDACTEDTASCQLLANRNGEQESYLLNTVDYAECGPDKVGCQWYETEKTINSEGQFDWPTIIDIEEDGSEEFDNTSRFHADIDIEQCTDGGCRELIVRNERLTYNMVQNGSFEDDEDGDRFPDNWLAESRDAVQMVPGEGVANGAGLLIPAGESAKTVALRFEPGLEYTVTLSAKPEDISASGTIDADLQILVDNPAGSAANPGDGAVALEFDGFGEPRANTEDTSCLAVDGFGLQIERDIDASAQYVQVSCTFTVPPMPDTIRTAVGRLELLPTGADMYIDDVQIEQNEVNSNFTFGYSTQSTPRTYAKLPPAYLGCTGSDSDPEACDRYAKVCSPIDQGCRLYTPTNGDPSVSAVIGEGNACPAVCVGYDTYRQEPTFYEPEGVFPNHFIPATATGCSADAAGCDEFTNLSTEEREYYSYLRACVNTDRAGANEGIYYTWEGTDTEGFQIITWNLIQTDMTEATSDDDNDAYAPCTSWVADEDGIVCQDDIVGGGEPGQAGAAPNVPDSRTEACDERSDIFSNPDCREFYDVEGRIHYREWSKTVTVNDSCTSYRKTETAGEDLVEKEANCTASGGYFESATGSCIYYGYAELSDACSAAQNGCRLYTGGRGNNSRIVITDTFEDGTDFDPADTSVGTIPGWDSAGRIEVARSAESLANEGRSIKSTNGESFWTYYARQAGPAGSAGTVGVASAYGETCNITDGESFCGGLKNQLFGGKTYTISFWAKGVGTLQVGFDSDAPVNTPSGGGAVEVDIPFIAANGQDQVNLSSEWREYRLGPLDLNERDFPGFAEAPVLVFDPDGAEAFIDNVVLREGEENIALIRDSWSTPAVCDTNSTGDFVPQLHLGCREYVDSIGSTVYLKSFSRLCGEDKVGCAAFMDTQASDSPYGQVFNAYCTRLGTGNEQQECYLESDGTSFDTRSPRLCTIQPGSDSCRFNLSTYIPEVSLTAENRMSHIEFESDTEVVSPDMPVYAVVTPANQCNSAEAGCTEVGVPVLSADQSRVDSWQTASLLLDPDNYSETLCRAGDLFCEEFTAPNQGKYFFKDPQEKVCEFRDNVRIGGAVFSGWFVEGTDNFCYGEGSCAASGTACTVDADCAPIVDTEVAGAGTCSVFGTACSQDSDCRLNESCLGVSNDVCVITDGTYIIGGDESGIWNNGDELYNGWVGTCDPSDSGCREFLDPLDGLEADTPYGNTEIKAYYYIENENLSDTALTGSRSCKGQASTEEGCILFDDTSIPQKTANTSATAIASEYADELYGTRKFDLVPPVDCDAGSARSTITTPGGAQVDLCANRCVYDAFRIDDIGSSPYTSLREFFDAGETLTPETLEGAYLFGGSCVQDTDCNPTRAESGTLVEGQCRSFVFTTGATVDGNTTPVPRLENDTNRVLKVNRTRSCAEWVAPKDCRRIWDPDLGRYRNSCASVQLCQEYDERGIDGCARPKLTDPALVLTDELYAARDRSWYGNDYSGYSIPGQFALNQLTQEKISPESVCVVRDSDNNFVAVEGPDGNPISCIDDASVCDTAQGQLCGQNPAPKFALAYNAGACDMSDERVGGFGGACNVGYCRDTGSACREDSDCPGSPCIIGVCIQETGDLCSQDSDCGPGAMCNAGVCEVETGAVCNIRALTTDAGPNFGCGPSAEGFSCRTSQSFKEGACINNDCLLTPDGEKFPANQEAQNEFAKVCRAHPEPDSPFDNNVVESWSKFDNAGSGTYEIESGIVDPRGEESAYPFDTRSGFESANICAPGEVCSCSYKKLSATGQQQYVEINTTMDEMTRKVSESLGLSGNGELGICSGGPASGAFCIIDGGNEYGCKSNPEVDGIDQVSAGSFGTCNLIDREDQLVGLRGYCLERDTAINVEGDESLGACLTYYPIDELRGETDLYGKAKSAGFFEDASYCGEIGNFANMKTFLGCSGQRGPTGTGDDNYPLNNDTPEVCQMTVKCPSGYFALVGPAKNAEFNSSLAGYCTRGGNYNGNPSDGALDLWVRNQGTGQYNDNACPFMCVPYDSFNDDGDLCEPPTSDVTATDESAAGTDYWYTNEDSGGKIDDWWDDYQSCTYKGYDLQDWSGSSDTLGIVDFMTPPFLPRVGISTYDYVRGESFAVPQVITGGNCFSARGYCDDVVTQSPFIAAEYYPACRSVVEVSDGNESYVFTDRLYSLSTAIDLNGAIIGSDTPNEKFGKTANVDTQNASPDPFPFPLPSCSFDSWVDGDEFIFDEAGSRLNPIWRLTDPFLLSQRLYAGMSGCSGEIGVVETDRDDGTQTVDVVAEDPRRGPGALDAPFAIPFLTLGLNDGSSYTIFDEGSDSFQGWAGGSEVTFSGRPDEFFNGYGTNIVKLGTRQDRSGTGLIQTTEGIFDIRNRLQAIIARTLGVRSFDFEGGAFGRGAYGNLQTSGALVFDGRDGQGTGYTPTPPTIASIDFNNCSGNNCREGSENQFSLNGETRQSFFIDEDGFFRATVEFFAAANKDQLPLRNIMVKWSDAEVAGGFSPDDPRDDNFYKNYRGLDDEDNPICFEGNEWGQTPESCEPGWLTFQNTYICNDSVRQGMLNEGLQCGERTADCYDIGSETCIFQPKVQIRDNWGWCTGTCTEGPDGTDGCFSPLRVSATEVEPGNECSINMPGESGSVDGNDPWIPYGGTIRIRKQD